MMGQTATEKMLEAASDESDIRAGDTVEVDVDVSWVHETQLGIFKEKFEELGGEVWDSDKAMFMIDHFPNPTSQAQADRLQDLREYANEKGIDVVEVGIKHQAWRMLGLARPGAIMAGPDSHTQTAGALGAFAAAMGPTDTAVIWNTGKLWLDVPETTRFELNGEISSGVTPRDVGFAILERFGQDNEYFAQNNTIEYGGNAITAMSLDGRQTMTNMGTEMGATNAFIEPDNKLKEEYLDPKVEKDYKIYTSDSDAEFDEKHTIDVGEVVPKVAYPYSPSNVHNVEEAVGISIDEFFLGSCANGHLEDLRLAASIMEGEEIPPDVKFIVTPATDEIRKQASNEGIIDIFMQAGAHVSSGYCSVCAGYEGVLAADEKCLSTNTRNYRGRMGHKDSETYLSSPATLAASAIRGEITDPREFIN